MKSMKLTLQNRSFWPWKGLVKGFSETEVAQLENLFGRRLPLAYKEFLLAMGHNAASMFGDVSCTFSSPGDLLEVRAVAETHWSDLGYPSIINKNTFIFSHYLGAQFSFFECDETVDDPLVFDYEAGYMEEPFLCGTFTDVLQTYFKALF